MQFNPINLFGGIIVVLMLLPNIVYAVRFRDAENKCTNRLLNILEQVGRYASMALMVLPLGVWKFGFPSVADMLIYVIGNGALLLTYYILWAVYFRRQSAAVSVALAIVPTLMFLLSGFTLRHWLLAVAAIIFGIGHIAVTWQNIRDNSSAE